MHGVLTCLPTAAAVQDLQRLFYEILNCGLSHENEPPPCWYLTWSRHICGFVRVHLAKPLKYTIRSFNSDTVQSLHGITYAEFSKIGRRPPCRNFAQVKTLRDIFKNKHFYRSSCCGGQLVHAANADVARRRSSSTSIVTSAVEFPRSAEFSCARRRRYGITSSTSPNGTYCVCPKMAF